MGCWQRQISCHLEEVLCDTELSTLADEIEAIKTKDLHVVVTSGTAVVIYSVLCRVVEIAICRSYAR